MVVRLETSGSRAPRQTRAGDENGRAGKRPHQRGHPLLTIKNGAAAAAVDFYVRAFGASEVFRHPADDGKRLLHAHLLVNGASVMMSDDFPEYRGGKPAPDPAGVTLHLQVDDADALWSRALAAGAVETMPLADQFWGDRYGAIRDPFGHAWSIASKSKKA